MHYSLYPLLVAVSCGAKFDISYIATYSISDPILIQQFGISRWLLYWLMDGQEVYELNLSWLLMPIIAVAQSGILSLMAVWDVSDCIYCFNTDSAYLDAMNSCLWIYNTKWYIYTYWHTDWHTHTDTEMQAKTILEGQNWPPVIKPNRPTCAIHACPLFKHLLSCERYCRPYKNTKYNLLLVYFVDGIYICHMCMQIDMNPVL